MSVFYGSVQRWMRPQPRFSTAVVITEKNSLPTADIRRAGPLFFAVFNNILQQKIKVTQKLAPNIHFIDIMPSLLTEEKVLKPEFVFNDTFISPSYVSVVEQQVSSIPPPIEQIQPQINKENQEHSDLAIQHQEGITITSKPQNK